MTITYGRLCELAQEHGFEMSEKLRELLRGVEALDESASYKRMFEDAVVSLAAIDAALGIDPDEAGGAAPILEAIATLKKQAAVALSALPEELRGIPEAIREGGGFWRTCTGCYESEDGHPVGHYPHSNVLDCALGGGCSECGGIGAVWDNTDYSAMVDYLDALEEAEEASQQQPKPPEQTSEAGGKPSELMRDAYDLGWLGCVEWSDRDDLAADMQSPAYINLRTSRLKALAGKPVAATTLPPAGTAEVVLDYLKANAVPSFQVEVTTNPESASLRQQQIITVGFSSWDLLIEHIRLAAAPKGAAR